MLEIKQAKDYFYNLHDIEVNQKYNKVLPYSFHLEMVAKQAEKFEHLIPCDNPYYTNIWVSIYGHDSIEDARLTYNDLVTKFNKEIAEIIYLCTEDKGRTRNERKSEIWYKELSKNKDAVFVKLCDIMSNSLFSLLSNSSMYDKYKREYVEKVKPNLYTQEYEQMFNYLDKIYFL